MNCLKCRMVNDLEEEINRLSEINKKLKEALQNCIPLSVVFTEHGGEQFVECNFCGNNGYEDVEHKEDCEYIRLTKVEG